MICPGLRPDMGAGAKREAEVFGDIFPSAGGGDPAPMCARKTILQKGAKT